MHSVRVMPRFLIVVCIIMSFLTMARATTTYTFQDGVGSYDSTVDTRIDESTGQAYPTTTYLTLGYSPAMIALIRFDDIFGSGQGQIPLGQTIISATLTVTTRSSFANTDVRFFRLLVPWADTDDWAAWGDGLNGRNTIDGVQVDGQETFAFSDARITDTTQAAGPFEIDVTTSLQAWMSGDTNYGWFVTTYDSVHGGWSFISSEYSTIDSRPMLTIVAIPEPATLTFFAMGSFVMFKWKFHNKKNGNARIPCKKVR